eukprot:1676412-Karenia_brevis.AAC.1
MGIVTLGKQAYKRICTHEYIHEHGNRVCMLCMEPPPFSHPPYGARSPPLHLVMSDFVGEGPIDDWWELLTQKEQANVNAFKDKWKDRTKKDADDDPRAVVVVSQA